MTVPFLSTLSLRRATSGMWTVCASSSIFLSTLSLRRATGRLSHKPILIKQFLSTLSLRRATAVSHRLLLDYRGFLSTLSLRRATERKRHICPSSSISIHALLAESDSAVHCLFLSISDYFYPRSPCGERRCCFLRCCCTLHISIHALLAESDTSDKPRKKS